MLEENDMVRRTGISDGLLSEISRHLQFRKQAVIADHADVIASPVICG